MLALEAADGLAITLVSAPAAAAYAGVAFLQAMQQSLGREIVVDCGQDAGLVMAGLRAGLRRLLFAGPEDVGRRLGEMAGQSVVMRSVDMPMWHLDPGEMPRTFRTS